MARSPAGSAVDTLPVGVPAVDTLPVGVPAVDTLPVGMPAVDTLPVGMPAVDTLPVGVPVDVHTLPVGVPVAVDSLRTAQSRLEQCIAWSAHEQQLSYFHRSHCKIQSLRQPVGKGRLARWKTVRGRSLV
jgi:hypothetical protein